MGVSSSRKPSISRHQKPFQPAPGRDFGQVEEVEAKTRGFLARVVVLGSMVGLAVSGCYSLVTGQYVVVLGVWGVVGPFLSAILTHYFGPVRDTG